MRWWVLLHYKVPSEPTARRVYVWRKPKRLGAVLLHDAVWVLPSTPHTLEQFQWLAAEIVEFEGTALVWEARLNLAAQEEPLIQQFLAQVEPWYQALLADLQQEGADLTALARRYPHLARIFRHQGNQDGRYAQHLDLALYADHRTAILEMEMLVTSSLRSSGFLEISKGKKL